MNAYCIWLKLWYVDLQSFVERFSGSHASEAACDATAWRMHIRFMNPPLCMRAKDMNLPTNVIVRDGRLSRTMSTSKNRLVRPSLPESDVTVHATSSTSLLKKSSLTGNKVR